MPNIIRAVVTEDALKLWPQMFGGLKTFKPILSFKIGEGGWIDEGAGPVPRVPDYKLRRLDNNIQDLDAVVDPTRPVAQQRYAAASRFTFSKNLVATDVAFIAPSTLQISCFLELAEANNDGFGNDPEFYEIGIFSDHPDFSGTQTLMVAYGTFARETKTASRRLENIVLISFSGP